MSTVLQHTPPARVVLRVVPRVASELSFKEIGYGYRPGGSLGLSVLAHGLAVVVVLFMGRFAIVPSAVVVPPQLQLTHARDILVLPTLGGGEEGSGRVGGGQGSGPKLSTGLLARSQRGFAYPGPQPMISSPPGATPGIQTILQPSLKNLPNLKRLVELPNIVQPPPPPAEAVKEPALVVKAEELTIRPSVTKPVDAPKVTLPVGGNQKLATVVHSSPQLPQRAVPDTVDASEIATTRGTHNTGLLVLNAVPPPPEVKGKIPRGEARSLFAVSPAEITVIADPGAGTQKGGPSMAAGTGGRNDLPGGDALAESAAGGSAGKTTVASGSRSGWHYGDGKGSGLNSTIEGTGSGRGTASGKGVGLGTSLANGSGAGAGSAAGTGGFRGITIQGGRYGNSGNMLASPDAKRQTSYNMTIESTAGSGGGLADFGVFHNEKIYTVYLDMRSDADDRSTPSWTLQYSVLQPAPIPGDAPTRINGTPTPPYAVLKEVPQFAPEILQRITRPFIVASAILDAAGKLEDLSIKQSPEPQLSNPLVEALKNWVFEPAKIDGQPVALKILLGIRLPKPR